MKSLPIKALVVIALLTAVPYVIDVRSPAEDSDSVLQSTTFGNVMVYARDAVPDSVVLFISGADGWRGTVVDMAQQLQDWGALVAGIDGRAYLASLNRHHDGCVNPAADLERLSRTLQQRAGIRPAQVPDLIGFGAGATLAYAAAAQAPPGTFAAVTSLGFCAHLPVQAQLCRGAGLQTAIETGHAGVTLEPKPDLTMPWVLLHGDADTTCPIQGARAFASHISSAKVVTMPKLDHAFAGGDGWLDQFRDAYLKLATATEHTRNVLPDDVRDLPLIEVPATAGTSRRMALLLTGDGGWAGLDRDVSEQFAASGIPVVALSTLRYFWSSRKPVAAARDLERIIDHYLAAWHKDQVVLVGYSFGADVLPFIVTDLAPAYRARIASLNLLGLATHTTFEIHVADWIPGSTPEGTPIVPIVDKLRGIRVLCIYGADETDSGCPLLSAANAHALKMPGDHHFNDDATGLVRHIVDFIGAAAPAPSR